MISEPDRYFLQLARMGAKLPKDFDISTIREHDPNTTAVVANKPSTIVTSSPITSQTPSSLPLVASFELPRLEHTLEPLIVPTNVLPLMSQNLNIPPFHVPQHISPSTMTVSMPHVTQAVHVTQAQTLRASQAIPISYGVHTSQTIPTTHVLHASQPLRSTTSHTPTANSFMLSYNPNVSLIDMSDPLISQANPNNQIAYVDQLTSMLSSSSNPSHTINPSYATQGFSNITQHMTYTNPHIVQNTNPNVHPSVVSTNPSVTYHVMNSIPTSQPSATINPTSTSHVMHTHLPLVSQGQQSSNTYMSHTTPSTYIVGTQPQQTVTASYIPQPQQTVTTPHIPQPQPQYVSYHTPPPLQQQQLSSADIQQMIDERVGQGKKPFSLENICAYPFDKSLNMIPFPPHFEIPQFDKYKGKGNPDDHLRAFFVACLDVAYDDTYLLRLFPRSLAGQALEWFSHLPPGIKTFSELATKFRSHFAFNIEHEVNMNDIVNNKQRNGETFSSFTQRWRNMASKLSWEIPEKQQLDIFVQNLHPELSFQLQLQSASTFDELVSKGVIIERALIAKGTIKIFRDNKDSPQNSNDKSRFWNKNKNVVNDGIVDTKNIQTMRAPINIQAASPPRQSFPQRRNQRQTSNPRRQFTPLVEPMEVILRKLLQAGDVILPDAPPNGEPLFRAPWYKENEYCDYHRVKGHKTNGCMRLKHVIQDCIDQGLINVTPSTPQPAQQSTSNYDLETFKNPLPSHDQTNNLQAGNAIPYSYASSTIGRIDHARISTITIQGAPDCAVTTRRGRVTVQGAPPHPPRPLSNYNLLDHLGKTPAHISILELLRLSPAHKAILDKALQESSVPNNINITQFQSMVASIAAPCHLTFSDKDLQPSMHPSHNEALHIEVFVNQRRIKRVLIDGGAGLNICSLKLIKQLGYSEKNVDTSKVITIRAYDDAERDTEGIILLPIQVGPVITETRCQVLDIDLPYNIILGRPWIHTLRAVPSTYHQCLKFPHKGVEVTIQANPNPFEFCHAFQAKY